MANDTAKETSSPARSLTLKDGRNLTYAHYGAPLHDAKTLPLFYFNGTPGCHLEANLITSTAAAQGIPIISTDRPGFGSSTLHPNRTLLYFASDVLELADHLGIQRFGVFGLSGGAPYVLACLYAIPKERLVGATTVSGAMPFSLGTKGMMWPTWLLFYISTWSTWLAEKFVDLSMGKMLRTMDEKQIIELMTKQAQSLPQPAIDKECMQMVVEDPRLRTAFVGSMMEALRVSSKGMAWEFWLFASDWGFDLSKVDGRRLTMWHGALDVNMPVGMPRAAAKLIEGAEYIEMKEDGHISLTIRHREEILRFMVKKFGLEL